MTERSLHRRAGSRIAIAALALVASAWLASVPARAGTLAFWDASSSPGVPVAITPPANEWPLDVDYAPSSAEGLGFYGFGDVSLVTTGDLTLSATGFACQTFGCLYFPMPFTGGPSITASGADNLAGEFGATADFMTLAVSGTIGHVAIVRGRYLDAGGVAQTIGNIQDVDATIIATVPEPGLGAGLAIGCLALARHARRARRSRLAPGRFAALAREAE